MIFDIQLFADTVTSSNYLKFNWTFADGDYRILSIPNPKTSNITGDVAELVESVVQHGLLLGDAAEGTVTGVSQVYREETTKTKLDLA